ncbi:septum site-determining protein MinD [Merdibacter massiliensis]|uniref:septum site-determining protein MinD n=1 Tax=Merdibacter massiliensis TaxID=1871030 RepID=UPI00096A2DCC|nr:septum site-determining protein MinD [Merdibacter massiliensis]
MGEIIAVTSGKGGVGKSSVCIHLGMMLAARGYKTCLIDADLGLKNLDLMMGLDNRVVFDMQDVIEESCQLERALLQDKREKNLYLLPVCKGVNFSKIRQEEFIRVMRVLQNQFDYLFIDTPAGVESGFRYASSVAQRALIVTNLDVSALQDADRVIGLLLKEGINNLELILNKVNVRSIEKGICVRMEDAEKWLAIPLLGYIVEDTKVQSCNNRGLPLTIARDSQVYHCFDVCTRRFLKEKVALPKLSERRLFAKLFAS